MSTLPDIPADLAGWQWRSQRARPSPAADLVEHYWLEAPGGATRTALHIKPSKAIGEARRMSLAARTAPATAVIVVEPVVELAPAGALSPQLQERALRFVAARRRSGAALLDMAAELAGAREEAEHGQWMVFLGATQTTKDDAARLLAIHRAAARSPAFREALERNWLRASTAALVAQSEDADTILARLLTQEQPPTVAEVKEARREISQIAKFDGPPAPADVRRAASGVTNGHTPASPDAEIDAMIAGLGVIEARMAEGLAGLDDRNALHVMSVRADQLGALALGTRAGELLGALEARPALPAGWSWRQRADGQVQAWAGSIALMTACFRPGQEAEAAAAAHRLVARAAPPAPPAPEPIPAPADAYIALTQRAQAAGLSLAWDAEGRRFAVYEGGRGPDARYSYYPAHTPTLAAQAWEQAAGRLEALLAKREEPPPSPAAAPNPDALTGRPAAQERAYAHAETLLAGLLAEDTLDEETAWLLCDILDLGDDWEDPREALWEGLTTRARERAAVLAERAALRGRV